MDTSKQYVIMCEKAKEIQEMADLSRDGDCFCAEGEWLGKKIFFNCHDEFEHYAECSLAETIRSLADRIIWLPRQDQLQEMLDNFTMGAKIREFFYFYEPEMRCLEDPTCEDCKQQGLYARKTFDSIEQLWLGFVMREKYNKVWNGKKAKWEEVE